MVDPEWLYSNEEEARALRQVMAGFANKARRVLHRVTYVERPALMGLGQARSAAQGLEVPLRLRLFKCYPIADASQGIIG